MTIATFHFMSEFIPASSLYTYIMIYRIFSLRVFSSPTGFSRTTTTTITIIITITIYNYTIIMILHVYNHHDYYLLLLQLLLHSCVQSV